MASGISLTASAAVAALVLLTPAAAAAPVQSAATPLLISGALPTACPATPDLDGRTFVRRSRRVLPTTDETTALVVVQGLTLHAAPAITLCDPDAAAERRVLGPFGGEATAALATDVVGFGTRALGAGERRPDQSALSVGDRITLPPVGDRAQLDLSVRTPGGARSVRFAAGRGVTAIRVQGDREAPVVVVERAGTAVQQVRVAPQPEVEPAIAAVAHGAAARFQVEAAPNTIVVVASTGNAPTRFALSLTGRSGRAPGLALRQLDRSHRIADVLLYNLPLRRVDARRCRLRWRAGQDELRSIRCAPRALPAAVASRLIAGATTSARASRPVALSARRTAEPVPPNVDASLETVMARMSPDGGGLTGDVNGDGRPDGVGAGVDDLDRPDLFVSDGASWRRVPVRFPRRLTDRELVTTPDVVPDVTGDGRAELRTEDGRYVTDAFASGWPAAVDLRTGRTPRPGDLDLGGGSPSGKERWWLPVGALSDRTGDGRPEPVLRHAGATATFASQDIQIGRRNQLATPYPLDFGRTYPFGKDEDNLSFFSPDTEEMLLGVADQTTIVRDGRLVSLAPQDPGAPAAGAVRQFVVQVRDADGATSTSAAVALRGTPKLLDADPSTGNVLVGTATGDCVWIGEVNCLWSVHRIAATRTAPVATITGRPLLGAGFVADGADADADPELVVWGAAGPRKGGLGLVGSGATGSIPFRSTTAITASGMPVPVAGPVTTLVLADGSRWLGTTVVRAGGRDEPTEFALVVVRPALGS